MGNQSKANENVESQFSGEGEQAAQSVEELKRNMEREIKMYEQNLDKARKMLDRLQKAWDRDRRIYELVLENDNHQKVEPTFKFEQIPEYWELKKGQWQEKYEEDKHMTEARIKQMEDQIEEIKQQKASSEQTLKEIEEGEKNEQ